MISAHYRSKATPNTANIMQQVIAVFKSVIWVKRIPARVIDKTWSIIVKICTGCQQHWKPLRRGTLCWRTLGYFDPCDSITSMVAIIDRSYCLSWSAGFLSLCITFNYNGWYWQYKVHHWFLQTRIDWNGNLRHCLQSEGQGKRIAVCFEAGKNGTVEWWVPNNIAAWN